MGYLPQSILPSRAVWKRILGTPYPGQCSRLTGQGKKTMMESWAVGQPEVVCQAVPCRLSTFFREFKFLYPAFSSFPFLSTLSLLLPPYLICLFLSLSILLSVLFFFSFSSPLCVALFSLFSVSVISISFPPSSGCS